MLGVAVRALAQAPTFSTEVKVITLLATVRDGDGAIVTNLNREDFSKRMEFHKPSGIFPGNRTSL